MPRWPARAFAEHFWRRVDRDGESCWRWLGGHNTYGYGVLRGPAGEVLRAHRVAFALAYGEVPDGAYILHRCDVRDCCNPTHLMAGDQSENMRQRWDRYDRFLRSPAAMDRRSWT